MVENRVAHIQLCLKEQLSQAGARRACHIGRRWHSSGVCRYIGKCIIAARQIPLQKKLGSFWVINARSKQKSFYTHAIK